MEARLPEGRGDWCGANSRRALSACHAEVADRKCLGCIRPIPAPLTRWPEDVPGWFVVKPLHVQAIRMDAPRIGWLVVVFYAAHVVDGRFPIIWAKDRRRAVAYALGRARQLSPGAPVKAWRDGSTWSVGDTYVTLAETADGR